MFTKFYILFVAKNVSGTFRIHCNNKGILLIFSLNERAPIPLVFIAAIEIIIQISPLSEAAIIQRNELRQF